MQLDRCWCLSTDVYLLFEKVESKRRYHVLCYHSFPSHCIVSYLFPRRCYNGRSQDVYNDVPFGEMLFEEDSEVVNSEVGGLMDTSITDAVIEYGFPVEFFLDTLCRFELLRLMQLRIILDLISVSVL